MRSSRDALAAPAKGPEAHAPAAEYVARVQAMHERGGDGSIGYRYKWSVRASVQCAAVELTRCVRWWVAVGRGAEEHSAHAHDGRLIAHSLRTCQGAHALVFAVLTNAT